MISLQNQSKKKLFNKQIDTDLTTKGMQEIQKIFLSSIYMDGINTVDVRKKPFK